MNEQRSRPEATGATRASQDTGSDAAEHVAEEAQNFEHTIRRLIIERDRKRATDPSFYR